VIGFLGVPALLSASLAWVAVGSPSFASLVMVNAVVAYPVFLALVLGYEATMGWIGKPIVICQHCLIVFVLVALVQLTISFVSFGSYGEYQWLGVVIVRGSQFTEEGRRFLSLYALGVGIKYALSVALFWAIVRRGAGAGAPSA